MHRQTAAEPAHTADPADPKLTRRSDQPGAGTSVPVLLAATALQCALVLAPFLAFQAFGYVQFCRAPPAAAAAASGTGARPAR